MQYIILTILLAVANVEVVRSLKSCVYVQDVSHVKEVLKKNVQSPYQLAIDHDTHTLFFSYTARTDEMFKIAYLSLKTGEYGIVRGINGGFATAVNNRGHVVYMGGEDGIYGYNEASHKATNLNVTDRNIWQMFYKDGLYFTTYPDEKVFFYKKGLVPLEVRELRGTKTMLIAVNHDRNFVYCNNTGVFLYNRSRKETIKLGDLVINGITTDIEGDLYFSTPSALYYYNEKTSQIEELFKSDNIYGFAIESNGNIIYALEDSIVRLKPTKEECVDGTVTENYVKTNNE